MSCPSRFLNQMELPSWMELSSLSATPNTESIKERTLKPLLDQERRDTRMVLCWRLSFTNLTLQLDQMEASMWLTEIITAFEGSISLWNGALQLTNKHPNIQDTQ